MNVINLLLSCYIMVVIHFPYGDNAKKLNALAVTWAIILWMVLENKPCLTSVFLLSLRVFFVLWY